MNEGSVYVEGIDDQQPESDTSEESQETEGESSDSESEQESDSTIKSTDQEAETKYTEKGTKLDPNPMSALNQQLANERRQREKYEQLLNNPDELKRYVSTFEPPKEEPKEEQIDPKKVETVEDIQKYLTQQDKHLKTKVQEFDQTIKSIKENEALEVISGNIRNDITYVRETYPELNPKSESYDPELDAAIGELFDQADLDQHSNRYLGKARLKDIADKVMKVRGVGKQAGSREAQTIVKDRRRGAAMSGGKNSTPDESNMSAAQIIASRMKSAQRRN